MKRPFFSRSDKRALLYVEWLLVIIVLGVCVYSWKDKDDVACKDNSMQMRTSKRDRGEKKALTYAVAEERVETFPFDPNTADSTTLLRLGLAPWQVRSIYRYRSKHGRYHTPEEFKRLPGMTHELWNRLGPMVRIAKEFQYLSEEDRQTTYRDVQKSYGLNETPVPEEHTTGDARTDTSAVSSQSVARRQEKLAMGSVVDLNRADTTLLKKVPGIASYRARKIVEYREKLGGFVSAEQVMEACEMPDDVLCWFVVEDVETVKINVNIFSVQKMMRHPYISFYMAKDIFEYRKKHGTIRNIEEMVTKGLLATSEKEKLQRYLEF